MSKSNKSSKAWKKLQATPQLNCNCFCAFLEFFPFVCYKWHKCWVQMTCNTRCFTHTRTHCHTASQMQSNNEVWGIRICRKSGAGRQPNTHITHYFIKAKQLQLHVTNFAIDVSKRKKIITWKKNVCMCARICYMPPNVTRNCRCVSEWVPKKLH